MADDLRHELVALLPRLRRFAYGLCGTMDEADDLVQAACERALLRSDQFMPGTRLDSWMFRIVQTIWLDRLRSAKRRKMVDDPEILDNVADDDRIHERTEARSDLAVIREEVARLPTEQRLVLSLVVVDGMSYKEAASTLEIPIGTVMSRLARARRRLAEILEAAPRAPAASGKSA
ncbi:MAG: sigma-70 family RNA polymerase sigma factor [Rhizobiales bacterium]|nr:sigma-70 family RNA polymerase sigma factor [Hyphomicrobiales bacterium]